MFVTNRTPNVVQAMCSPLSSASTSTTLSSSICADLCGSSDPLRPASSSLHGAGVVGGRLSSPESAYSTGASSGGGGGAGGRQSGATSGGGTPTAALDDQPPPPIGTPRCSVFLL